MPIVDDYDVPDWARAPEPIDWWPFLQGLRFAHCRCEYCGAPNPKRTPCRTAYADEGDPVLCVECAKEYHEYWDEMWSHVPHD